MLSRELPLWARAIGAVLLIIGSWWVTHTDGLTEVAGGSVGILALGIVAMSIVRGLGAPLRLWPEGHFRDRFLPWVVVATALAFGLFIGSSGVGVSAYADHLIDPGLWVMVVAGVVVWGGMLAIVRQRPYVLWIALALALAGGPYLIGGIASDVGSQACLWNVGDVDAAIFCEIGLVGAAAFFVPAAVAGSLLTFEIGFRRLLIGEPEGAGVFLVVFSAMAVAVWGWVVGVNVPLIAAHSWVLGASAVAAGSLYVLSGSLAVSATYVGTVLGTQVAIDVARDRLTPGFPAMLDAGGALMWLHVAAGVTLLVLVWRRHGFLGGVR